MWQIKAELEGIKTSSADDRYHITFVTDELGDRPHNIDYPLNIEISKWMPPKSNKANGYYWRLVNQLSDAMSKEGNFTSVARIHNNHLRTMWQKILKLNNGSVIPLLIADTDKAEYEAMEDPDTHIMPIPVHLLPKGLDEHPMINGKKYIWYMELRGCRTFDSKEFSNLLDICIEQCHLVGINTTTLKEAEQLKYYESISNK